MTVGGERDPLALVSRVCPCEVDRKICGAARGLNGSERNPQTDHATNVRAAARRRRGNAAP